MKELGSLRSQSVTAVKMLVKKFQEIAMRMDAHGPLNRPYATKTAQGNQLKGASGAENSQGGLVHR